MSAAPAKESRRGKRSGVVARLRSGERFGRWVLVESRPDAGKYRWLCRCDCGAERAVKVLALCVGSSRSCGCLAREELQARARIHGHATKRRVDGKLRLLSAEYGPWQCMKDRCLNVANDEYHNYGGRGITVYPDWIESFEAFLGDVGPRPTPRHSLDRYPDCNGNYEPGNVRWATPKQQSNNMRRTRWITYQGETRSLQEWAEFLGMNHKTLRHRLEKGWSAEKVLTRPIGRWIDE